MLFAGIAVCLLAAVLWAAGFGFTAGDTSAAARRLLDEKVKELQAKEERVKSLEVELAKARQEIEGSAKNDETLKFQLEESRKARQAAEARLSALSRELERRSMRAAKPEPTIEPPVAGRASPASAASARSASPTVPTVYETTRPTEVHEQPMESSRVLSRIGTGTRINVVRANGEWLEVVSRRGNPPGFVLRHDAVPATASN
jgi:hypothetical protein